LEWPCAGEDIIPRTEQFCAYNAMEAIHMFRNNDQLQNACQPPIETLEQRRLLSASLHGGLLAIKGTKGADDIQIEVEHDQIVVTMDGSSKSFNLSGVRRIKAIGGKGDDNIHFNSAGGKLSVPMTLIGGVGDDTLVGGNGDDVLKGGAGDDDCQGGAGDDSVHGDAGDDTCSGGTGDDSVGGSDGDDDLHGDKGNDSVDGGAGNDSVAGSDGSDDMKGGAGNDDVDGGKGHDNINGGKGRDHFHSDDAENEIEDKHGNDDDEHDVNDDHGGNDSGSDDMLS
jgi:Ca2+-binding RTX toxin-like protein